MTIEEIKKNLEQLDECESNVDRIERTIGTIISQEQIDIEYVTVQRSSILYDLVLGELRQMLEDEKTNVTNLRIHLERG